MFCLCGCGALTPLAKFNDPRRRHVKDRPLFYIAGHYGRGRPRPEISLAVTKSYRMARAKSGGRNIRLHVLRAEKALGHPLPIGAEVHHADRSKRDEAPLVICQDRAYHSLLHVRMKVVKAGGNPNTQRICGQCKTLKPIDAFTAQMTKCRACRNTNYRLTHATDVQRRKQLPQ